MPHSTELELAYRLATEIQHVSTFLNKQRLIHTDTPDSATAFSFQTVRHAMTRLATVDKKQVVIADRLAASSKREQTCHQQLESQAVSTPGRQRLVAALEAEKLLKAGYTNQLRLLKDSLQDILVSLCETLNLHQRQNAASEASTLAEDVQLLNEITSKFQINQRASMATTGLSGRQLSNSRRTRWRVRDSGKDHVLAATDHMGINSSNTACAAAALQSSPSFSRTSGTSMSKASRYLQKHAAQRPSALQQMQAFSQRHSKDTDGNHNQASLADSCSSLVGLSSKAMQQLQLATVSEALSNASEGAAAIEDDTGMTGLYQAATGNRPSEDEQRLDMQMRQSMLRSHPVLDSRAASPCAEDRLRANAVARLKADAASSDMICRAKSLPLGTNLRMGAGQQSTDSGLAGFSSSTLLQALQDSVLQLEARASIAEAGKAAAQFQLTQIRQQLAVESRAHEVKLAALTDHIAHQDAVLAGAAKYLGPLESRVDPVSPVQSPRLQSASPISDAEQRQ